LNFFDIGLKDVQLSSWIKQFWRDRTVARKKKAANGKGNGEVTLVRRHKESGETSPRKRGRPHPDFELGYLDASGNFQAGNPPKRRRRRGRPVGSGKGPGRPRTVSAAGGLNEIEQIVRREVSSRLKAAREAAISAFNRALGV
jgi:hypothetical protein